MEKKFPAPVYRELCIPGAAGVLLFRSMTGCPGPGFNPCGMNLSPSFMESKHISMIELVYLIPFEMR